MGVGNLTLRKLKRNIFFEQKRYDFSVKNVARFKTIEYSQADPLQET